MFKEAFAISNPNRFQRKEIKKMESFNPVRPSNGINAIQVLKQDTPIEVNNEVALWFVEELEKKADFSFYYHRNKCNKGWTTICKVEN